MNRQQFMLVALLLGAPGAAFAADDIKIMQLEQDVRDLQRQVQAQSQLIAELRAQINRPVAQPVPAAAAAAGVQIAAEKGAVWLDAARWQQVKPGMGELEVVSLLGPPTSMREKDGDRVLMYAMEIGSSGFLSGSVTLRDRIVLRTQKPELR
jgi:hypothetical protein